jgi:hypothetical protein
MATGHGLRNRHARTCEFAVTWESIAMLLRKPVNVGEATAFGCNEVGAPDVYAVLAFV